MRIKVEFYDMLRELAGQREWLPDVPDGTTVSGVMAIAKRVFPALGSFPGNPVFTSGLDYVEADHVLRDGETLSVLPPPPRF